MPCEILRDANGTGIGIICGRRRGGKKKPCFVRDCRGRGEVLCDWVLKAGAPDRPALTCDRLCCRRDHSRPLPGEKDKHYCLEHVLKARKA